MLLPEQTVKPSVSMVVTTMVTQIGVDVYESAARHQDPKDLRKHSSDESQVVALVKNLGIRSICVWGAGNDEAGHTALYLGHLLGTVVVEGTERFPVSTQPRSPYGSKFLILSIKTLPVTSVGTFLPSGCFTDAKPVQVPSSSWALFES